VLIYLSEFDKSAKLSEINGMINLVPLCPNHHWEFDNGLITREEIVKIKNKDSFKLIFPE
jgi:predicted restriction endonuclease